MLAKQALDKFLTIPNIDTVLDIGCGNAIATETMRNAGKTVTALDIAHNPKADVIADFMEYREKPFDAIWCAHVLEHQHSPNAFLKKIKSDIKPDGWLAITVPPRKDEIVGGHISLWNAGLLVYHLVLAGFDCSNCKIKTYDYNCSVIVQNKDANLPVLNYARGDIEKLKPYLPDFFSHGVNGVIEEWNWNES